MNTFSMMQIAIALVVTFSVGAGAGFGVAKSNANSGAVDVAAATQCPQVLIAPASNKNIADQFKITHSIN